MPAFSPGLHLLSACQGDVAHGLSHHHPLSCQRAAFLGLIPSLLILHLISTSTCPRKWDCSCSACPCPPWRNHRSPFPPSMGHRQPASARGQSSHMESSAMPGQLAHGACCQHRSPSPTAWLAQGPLQPSPAALGTHATLGPMTSGDQGGGGCLALMNRIQGWSPPPAPLPAPGQGPGKRHGGSRVPCYSQQREQQLSVPSAFQQPPAGF